MIVDLRHEQSKAGPESCGKVVRGALVMRDPKTVDTIVGHQMGVFMGVAPYMVQAAKGDRALAKHRRALKVHAHVSAFIDGAFVPAYEPMAYLYHGNGSNAYSVGVETEGLYNGIPGGKLDEPSDLVIEATREACTWLVEECARVGSTLRYYEAHRQHAASRRSDPGHRLWQAVYVEHCERVLGLKPRPDVTTRDGRPIPRMWDQRQTDGY